MNNSKKSRIKLMEEMARLKFEIALKNKVINNLIKQIQRLTGVKHDVR